MSRRRAAMQHFWMIYLFAVLLTVLNGLYFFFKYLKMVHLNSLSVDVLIPVSTRKKMYYKPYVFHHSIIVWFGNRTQWRNGCRLALGIFFLSSLLAGCGLLWRMIGCTGVLLRTPLLLTCDEITEVVWCNEWGSGCPRRAKTHRPALFYSRMHCVTRVMAVNCLVAIIYWVIARSGYMRSMCRVISRCTKMGSTRPCTIRWLTNDTE